MKANSLTSYYSFDVDTAKQTYEVIKIQLKKINKKQPTSAFERFFTPAIFVT